ncbi:MAG: nucleotidyltransferase domain-containing protein [Desulfobacula sp.]|nr:nucleotidyltransferase domain-containing protein [Desulfobacula sp.]MDA8134486.1 nucleotidyltransferase domain-containing protein [Desulfobacteraceae bacterium]
MEGKIQNYFRGKKEIAAVYLFGSFASGKFTETSDIDLAVLFEHSRVESAESLKEKYMSELGRILRKDIDIIVMNTAGEMLLNQIYKKGKPILNQNMKFEKIFKIKAFMVYSDFEFYLKHIQHHFIRNIMETEHGG